MADRTYAQVTGASSVGKVRVWCVVKKMSVCKDEHLHAALLQRVKVPPRQASEHRVAGPIRAGEIPTDKRGVKSLLIEGGSKNAGRNMK